MISRLLQGPIFLGVWLAFEGGRLAVRFFPRRFIFGLSRVLADLGFYLFRRFRRRSMSNLSLALGERHDEREIGATARASLRNFFRDFAEMALVLEAPPEKIRAEIALQGREHLEAALAKGRGVIALSAHIGNFFLVGTRLAAEGFPIYVLVKQAQNGRLSKLLDQYRLEVGQKTIHARPRRQAFRRLLQVLRQNGITMVIADEYRSGEGISVPFFGRPVTARRGPATLALRSGAVVVPLYLIREPGAGLKLIIEPELELARSGEIQSDVRENTRLFTQWLERVVRSYPDQWNWTTVRWHERLRPTANARRYGNVAQTSNPEGRSR